MEWRDEAVLIALRRHGETSAIAEVFSAQRGRHAGVIRGATSRKIAPVLQLGAQLDVTWRARLDAHLGTFSVEPVRSRAAAVMADRLALAALASACALLSAGLPERAAQPGLYAQTQLLFDLMGESPAWPIAYLRWELSLLEELGFALELDRCAVTGAETGLVYVSPRTGRAVSEAGAGDWAERLLPLPPVLRGESDLDPVGIRDGLRTTGHFLAARLAPAGAARGTLPEARRRFAEAQARAVARDTAPDGGA